MCKAKKLTRAEKQQINAAIQNARRQDKRHKSAQDSIPFQRMFPDGICRVTDLTVKENAYLRGAMLGYTRKFMDETYPYIIEFSELKEFEDRPFKQLSSGMKSRLAFAIASFVKPEILILDEVLSVGDGAFRAKSEAKMREIIKGGATTILVSHSIPQVRAMCNKVLWLENGRQIAFTDDIEEACDCYEEYLRNRKEGPVYDPVAAKIRIDARAAEKARRESAARQMAEDAAKLQKVRAILKGGAK